MVRKNVLVKIVQRMNGYLTLMQMSIYQMKLNQKYYKFLKIIMININFFSMKVTPIYPNWKRPRLLSASHQCVRLYNKKFGRFSNSPVHDSVQTNNLNIFYFKNPIYHNSVRSFAHLIEKEKSYIQLQSKTLTNKNKIFYF